MLMQKTAIFMAEKMVFFSVENLRYFLTEAVLTSTHDLYFRAKKNKKNYVYPCKRLTPVLLYIKVYKGV